MNVVVFLGAGFSKPFGLPVMDDFLEVADNSQFLSDADKHFLRKLHLKARGSDSMLHGRDANLEHVLSMAMMAGKFSMRGNDEEAASYERLCRILRTIYGPPETAASNVDALRGAFDALLVRATDERYANIQRTIITTNHDLMAEYLLFTHDIPASIPSRWKSGFERSPEDRRLHGVSGIRGIPICKLHGSLNWFRSKDDPALLLVDDRVAPYTTMGVDSRFGWPVSCGTKRVPEDPPLILPPMFFKESIPPCLTPLWTKAREALREADVIAFVGYSFPATDAYMMYFIATSLSENRHFVILLLDPEAERIAKRLEDEIHAGHTLLERLRCHTGEWQGGNCRTIEAYVKPK